MRQIDAETTPSLLLRIRDPADSDAWQDFVNIYSPLIYGYCRKRGLQSQDSADITQEVLLRVNRAIGNFEYRPEVGLFRDWLAKIVKNEISRFASNRGKALGLEQLREEGEESQLWLDHFHQHVLATAISKTKTHFQPGTWNLFSQTWLEKKPAALVADENEVGIEQVYVAKSRVLKRLKHEVYILAEDSP